MGQVGIPLFYLQGMGGGAVLKFRDLFNDGSLYWGWRQYLGQTPTGKSGWETTGRYFLQINSGIDGKWDSAQTESPRIFVGVLSYPCEIVTRLDTFTNNANTYAGLFIAKDPIGFGADLYFSIGRGGVNNGELNVYNTGNWQAGLLLPTLPIWLRIRLGCGSFRGLNIYFDYSEDGRNWVNLWEENSSITLFSVNPPAVGLMVRNISPSYNDVSASFDHFIMRPRSIN